jgi:hypothetical protein
MANANKIQRVVYYVRLFTPPGRVCVNASRAFVCGGRSLKLIVKPKRNVSERSRGLVTVKGLIYVRRVTTNLTFSSRGHPRKCPPIRNHFLFVFVGLCVCISCFIKVVAVLFAHMFCDRTYRDAHICVYTASKLRVLGNCVFPENA